MQNAKDTFFTVMRDRLMARNPGRTVVIRGAARPGLVVEENEIALPVVLPDCFRMRWVNTETRLERSLPLVVMSCDLVYETAGNLASAGMERGRALAGMDAEVLSIVSQAPMRATKVSYAGLAKGDAAVALQSAIWWSAPVFGEASSNGALLRRTAHVTVMSYEEPAEE